MTDSQGQQLVHIIDDDDAVRDAMSMLLSSDAIEHKCYQSAVDFLENYDGNQRGCLVLDIRMPGMSGLELQARLKEMDSSLPIIFMTGHGDVPMAVEAMRQGAIDFMRKPICETDLLERIHEALSEEAGNWDERQIDKLNREKVNSLTAREYQIYELVAAGLANKAIALEFGISERTVEVHRSQVMKKLEARTLAQVVRIHISTADNIHSSTGNPQ